MPLVSTMIVTLLADSNVGDTISFHEYVASKIAGKEFISNLSSQTEFYKSSLQKRYSAIGKHLKNDHGLEKIGDLTNNFSVLKKCNGKLDCLIYEMLFIKKRPCFNTQSNSIRAKLFI